MNDNEINVAIAEACGYRNQGKIKGVKALEDKWLTPNAASHFVTTKELPNYTTDLNAMHEAEEIIDQMTTDGKSLWWDYLAVTCGWPEASNHHEARFEANYNSARATARQRAEAFLRTIGKWQEQEKGR